MISLTVAGTNGTVTATDTGQSGYVLLPGLDFGIVSRDNSYAESRWLDGASLLSSRTGMRMVSASLQVWGTTIADVQTKVATLGSAIDAFTYTVTAVYSGGSAVYTACPASYSVAWDRDFLRNNMAVMTMSIPVQP